MTHWHDRFLSLAEYISSWSKDPSTKVGAVIVDNKNRIISCGYNGLPRKIADDSYRLANREIKLKLTIHAEMNAILFADQSLEFCTLYCTHPPCSNCAAMIIQTGLYKVIWPTVDSEFLARWNKDILLTYEIFEEACMLYETIERK